MATLSDNSAPIGPARPDPARRALRIFPVGRYVLLYREIAGGVEIVRCVLRPHVAPAGELPDRSGRDEPCARLRSG